MSRSLSPPGGMRPPATITTSSGREIDLVAAARDCCAAYDAEFPDERERYGPAGMEWCRHDNQHLLNWAVMDLDGHVDLEEQVSWLARVLEARDFPLARLARDLELLAEVVSRLYPEETALAARLRDAAALVRSRETFLD